MSNLGKKWPFLAFLARIYLGRETVEPVSTQLGPPSTPLKRGVNERGGGRSVVQFFGAAKGRVVGVGALQIQLLAAGALKPPLAIL